MDELTARQRAENGRDRLNERGPADWAWKIDPDTVEVWSLTDCPLAQLYVGNSPTAYSSGVRALGIGAGSDFTPFYYGFDPGSAGRYSAETEALDQAWREIIAEERARNPKDAS